MNNVKPDFLLKLTVLLFVSVFLVFPLDLAAAQDDEFQAVELDRFIEQEKETAEAFKKKVIRKMEPVKFSAKMKRYPEEKKMSYVYMAMQVAGVNPLPEVKHRMFVESGEGRIIPVYVEKQAAAKLRADLKEEQAAQFLGYHVYTYDKGPAILVVDFLPGKDSGKAD